MKDNFSLNADLYLQYRPDYPENFFESLKTFLPTAENVWDCGTGNGQVAQRLAKLYKNVFASDISQSQLNNAVRLSNINYSVQPAEKTNFPDDFFDLVIVAQAVHWFDFDKFYLEVNRTCKNNSLIVILGYNRIRISERIDQIIDNFYFNIIGNHWDKERRYIDENYQTIPFPYKELKVPEFQNEYQWTFEHLIGYLGTWSAVKHYIKDKSINPVDVIFNDLKRTWGPVNQRRINFPLLFRIGKIEKF